jgi:hypothetical protein
MRAEALNYMPASFYKDHKIPNKQSAPPIAVRQLDIELDCQGTQHKCDHKTAKQIVAIRMA